jgi:predicted GH43/DUF377 family glycosyl hydrolase
MKHFPLICFFLITLTTQAQVTRPKIVTEQKMQKVFEEVKTPYKYGVVLTSPDSKKMVDSPTVFRKGNRWYMTYIVFDGKGYETWLATSPNLLDWTTQGKIMSFTENTWDASQKAGYVALIDTKWGGTYEPMKYEGNYWVSYLGGSESGYEAGQLGVGMATTTDLTKASELSRLPNPVLSANDRDARWFDNKTIFKSSVIYDKDKKAGYPFLMYYNAAGDSLGSNKSSFESIAMAGSYDMNKWDRMGTAPVITRGLGICGDAQIVKMKDLYVMFYFGAFWKPNAFERFACSYDLENWTDWKGEDLIAPSEPFDQQYAHKPWVIKWKGVVYHFYNAVGKNGRVIALATSKDLKK